MMKLVRNIMLRTRLFLANVRNTPKYDALDAAGLTAIRAVSPRAIVKQDSGQENKEQHPGGFDYETLNKFGALDFSEQHGGGEVGQVHQWRQPDDRVPRVRQHVEREHVAGEEEAEQHINEE